MRVSRASSWQIYQLESQKKRPTKENVKKSNLEEANENNAATNQCVTRCRPASSDAASGRVCCSFVAVQSHTSRLDKTALDSHNHAFQPPTCQPNAACFEPLNQENQPVWPLKLLPPDTAITNRSP